MNPDNLNNIVGYPALLQNYLGKRYNVSNYGNSGTTLLLNGMCGPPRSGLYGDCAYMRTGTWPAALASEPDIVT